MSHTTQLDSGLTALQSSLPTRPPHDIDLGDPGDSMPLADTLVLEAVRPYFAGFTAQVCLDQFPHLEHSEHSIPVSDGDSIILSVFAAKNSTSSNRPALYYIHGGGQVSGNRFSLIVSTIDYFVSSNIDAVFVSVEYRLAPEHPAPAGVNDCYAGLVWVADHAKELGIDASKIMIAGLSGGGALAAGAAILARNKNYPQLCAQLLMTPMLDDRNDTVSAKQFERSTVWTGIMNRMAWDMVLGPQIKAGDKVDEIISPARATDLSGLPPTFIDVGGSEVFRDEAVAYATQIWKSGGSAELHVWPGAWHGFDISKPDAPVSRACIAAKKTWIRRIFREEASVVASGKV